MSYDSRHTIVALSSGALPAGVAVIRLSGDDVRRVLITACGSVPEPRRAVLRDIGIAEEQPLDRGLVLFFPAPHSYTGEDVAELHVHGGRAVVRAVLEAICTIDGCRLAEPGEFSRRALLNGKLDLHGAEAIADIISADTSAQHRFAIANATGGQAAVYAAWRERLIAMQARIEADLDFADESDVPEDLPFELWRDMQALADHILEHISLYHKSEIVQDGYRVVLLGAPNVGKSSLLNALSQRDVAIVSEEAGTTRDAVDVRLDLGGYKVVLTDTAGLRDTDGVAEMKGIARAKERAVQADLVLWLSDSGFDNAPIDHPNIVRVGTKADLSNNTTAEIAVSSLLGSGLDELLGIIGSAVRASAPAANEVVPWKLRHIGLLMRAYDRINGAAKNRDVGLELVVEELRCAGKELGMITGHIHVDDLLDEIFASFCVGK